MKTITVFTPTYNRAYCLHQLYDSLIKQTNKDFEWLIIDDGSTDNTKDVIGEWVKENKIIIKYFYKENGGMHTAHNAAYNLIETELNVCIDSDDFMTENAVELILNKWEVVKVNKSIAGIIGLDSDIKGDIIGSRLPVNLATSTLYDLHYNHGVTGDKKLVYRTKTVKGFPIYPVFKEERLVSLGVLYLMIDQKYKIACLNEVLCVVEYLSGGSSDTIFAQYKQSPKGFRYSRTIELLYMTDFKEKVKKVMHLISSTLFIGDFHFFKNNPQKVLTLLCFPFGVFFHLYVLLKIKQK